VLRRIAFIFLFWSWATVVAFALLPLLVMPRRAMVAAGRGWAVGVMWIAKHAGGLDYRLEGLENLPDGPVIIASKHQSMWDTIVIIVVFHDPVAIVKKELLLIPFYGWYARKIGVIQIDRARGSRALRHLLAAAETYLAAGRTLVLFPEGTRTVPGQRRPYRGGVAMLYERLGLPVVPVALNSGLFWPRRRFHVRPGCITMRLLPAIPPGLTRAELMHRLEDTIETATAELVAAETDGG
jgi:1-acyl-sn-glycerol-3-phosphate acyltransferase